MPRTEPDIQALATVWLTRGGKIEIEFSDAFFEFDPERQLELATRVAHAAVTEVAQIADDAIEALDATETPEEVGQGDAREAAHEFTD
jgi:hypothetical protein